MDEIKQHQQGAAPPRTPCIGPRARAHMEYMWEIQCICGVCKLYGNFHIICICHKYMYFQHISHMGPGPRPYAGGAGGAIPRWCYLFFSINNIYIPITPAKPIRVRGADGLGAVWDGVLGCFGVALGQRGFERVVEMQVSHRSSTWLHMHQAMVDHCPILLATCKQILPHVSAAIL